MKYGNKNYIGVGSLPFIMVPVIVLTIWLTISVKNAFNAKPPETYSLPETSLMAGREEIPADTSEFKTGDEALFSFTGDTVLVLTHPDSSPEFDEEVRVLHKTVHGNLETIDLPENWLVKLPVGSVSTKKYSVAGDKLLQYNKAAK